MTEAACDVLKRRDDENDHQYLWRVGTAKDSGLINLNWPDLAEAINRELHGDNKSEWLHECVYRKEFRAAKEYYDNVFSHLASDERLREIERQQKELRKLKQQTSDQRRELAKHERLEARAEHLRNVVREAASGMPAFELKEKCITSGGPSEYEAVLFLNDWHYGMTTDNVWNKYSIDICKARVNDLYVKVSQYLQRDDVKTLHVVLLGDMCHGAIHTSARVESEETVCNQLIQVSELIARLIDGLTGFVEGVHVYSTYGNHMRTVQNKNDSAHYDNMERIIPWWLAERFRDHENVSIVEQNEYGEIIHVCACHKNILAVHGDLDRLRQAGTTLHTVFSKRYGIDVDYVVMGDKHHSESLDVLGIDCTIAPALCGTDGYAHAKRLYSEPGQIMMLFSESMGSGEQECIYKMTFR